MLSGAMAGCVQVKMGDAAFNTIEVAYVGTGEQLPAERNVRDKMLAKG